MRFSVAMIEVISTLGSKKRQPASAFAIGMGELCSGGEGIDRNGRNDLIDIDDSAPALGIDLIDKCVGFEFLEFFDACRDIVHRNGLVSCPDCFGDAGLEI